MTAEVYPLLYATHVACVGLSLALFVLRGWWLWRGSPWRHSPWARVIPHVNDTLLLAAGIGLALTLRQYPFVAPWLTAKLAGLVLHIGLGLVALRGWLPGRAAGVAWIGSVVSFGYVVGVALSRDPWLGLAG